MSHKGFRGVVRINDIFEIRRNLDDPVYQVHRFVESTVTPWFRFERMTHG